jgi:hypothetical protein
VSTRPGRPMTDSDQKCKRCRRPFDPTDNESTGAARYAQTQFCRGCVDRCHESTDAFHQCPICADVEYLTVDERLAADRAADEPTGGTA